MVAVQPSCISRGIVKMSYWVPIGTRANAYLIIDEAKNGPQDLAFRFVMDFWRSLVGQMRKNWPGMFQMTT